MRFVEAPGWQAEVKRLAEAWRGRIVEDIADDARDMAAVDTSEMRSSIRTDQGAGRVYVGTDHWHFNEYGTRAHVIEPDEAEALSWPGGAHPVEEVHHPGTKAQPFMRPALYQKRSGR